MRLNRILPVVLVGSSLGLIGCDEPGPSEPEISMFAGAWTATTVQYTAHADAQRSLDIVQFGGALSLNIDSDGDFSGSLTFPGEDPIPLSGSVTLVGNNQADIDFVWPAGVTPPIEDFRATYTLQGDNLTFTRPSTMFHFPGQSAPEEASLVIIMER